MAEIVKPWCPFGCKQHQFDANGYCRHLVGFSNIQEGEDPVGAAFEVLEPITREQRNDEGIKIGKAHSGLMRVNGRKLDAIRPDDRVVFPLELQEKQTIKDRKGAVIYVPRLGFSARVYRPTGNTHIITDEDAAPKLAAARQKDAEAKDDAKADDLATAGAK